MAPRSSVSLETLTLIWRSFCVYAERHLGVAGATTEGCFAREGSEAYFVATSAVGAVCLKEPGQFTFNSSAVYHRPNKDAFNSLPLYLSRRYPAFVYDPVRRYAHAGGFAALCAAIDAAHNGRTVDRVFFQGGVSADGFQAVGGWGPRLPDPLAGGDYNAFTAPLALEKQVEYRMPLIKPEPTGPVFCATELETRACAQPVLEFASLLLKPQVLLSVVPEPGGTIIVDHQCVSESGKRQSPPVGKAPTYTEVRDYRYALDSSPKTSALLRDTLRTIGAGLHKALRYTFVAFVKAPTDVPAVSSLGLEYAVSPAWASTSTFDGAVLAHFVDPQGVCSDNPIGDTKDAAGKAVLSDRQVAILGKMGKAHAATCGASLRCA